MARKRTPTKSAKLDPDDWLGANAPADDEAPAVALEEGEDERAVGTAGILVSKSRLGMIFGMSAQAVEKAFANGAPYVSKGTRKEGWKINTAAFESWRREELRNSIKPDDPNKVSFDDAKTRKMLADAVAKERDNALKRRELVTIDEAIMVAQEESSIIRAHLMVLPGRLAIPAAAESDPSIVEQMVMDEVNVALSNIVSDQRETWIEGAGHDSDGSAEAD